MHPRDDKVRGLGTTGAKSAQRPSILVDVHKVPPHEYQLALNPETSYYNEALLKKQFLTNPL